MTEVYDVHMYHVMRAKFCAIKADSHEHAIEIIRETDFDYAYANEHEDAEEITGWLVDVVGDEDFENTRGYEADGVTRDGLRYFYIRFEDDNCTNWDLLVNAYSEGDAFKVWQETYEDAVEDVGFEDVEVNKQVLPAGRGAAPWR